jgi:rhamnulokinase
MDKSNYLAFDIGASSGRAILGSLSGNEVELIEIHRFTNEMSYKNGHYHWDIYHLFDELKAGLKKCVHDYGVIPDSIGIDTWGVDFGLLDENNDIIGWPFAYRDSITDNSMQEVFSVIDPFELYRITGIQFMKFNSIFQLWAIKKKYPDIVDRAKKLLFMPDLLGYMFTGRCWSERTIASTSQLIDPETGVWLKDLMDRLGLPHGLMQEIVEPGTVMGNIKKDICRELNCPDIPLVASCEHDTASAIASIPAKGDHWAYISSGTWSLMGMELSHPVLNRSAYEGPFTNEGGFAGTTRFLKNITGLWLLQECKKKWDMKEEMSYAQLVEKSLEATAFRSFVDPDHPDFMNPEDMEKAIADYCLNTGQPAPLSIAEVTRCIFESLAMKYRYTLDLLLKASPANPDRLHIIGGGTQNEVLCQYTANATGLKAQPWAIYLYKPML